jgi:hypothetical protein
LHLFFVAMEQSFFTPVRTLIRVYVSIAPSFILNAVPPLSS